MSDGVADRQAAEAREAIAQALLGVSYAQALAEWEGGELAGTVSGEAFGHLVALSVRLAQAEAMKGLWGAYVASGSDPDGGTKWHTRPADAAPFTVDAVKELRRDYADALDELNAMEVRLRAYEEAARAILFADRARAYPVGEQMSDAIEALRAASGGREAPKEERLDE